MNKQELVDAVAQKTDCPKGQVEEILLAVLEEIQEQVRRGKDVTIMGFGTFLLGRRRAGKGYNPHTGEEIDLPEILLPKFRAGKAFKERLKK